MKQLFTIVFVFCSVVVLAQNETESTEMSFELENLSIERELEKDDSIDMMLRLRNLSINRKLKVGDKIRLDNVNFEPGTTMLVPSSNISLLRLLKLMKERQNINIVILGHTCCGLWDQSDLSARRARTVYKYLIDNGVETYRMTYVGLGSSKPIHTIPESTSWQRKANRRVEIMITKA